MKSLKPRLLTAGIGIFLLLVVLFFGESFPIIISCVFSFATAFMIGEYLHADNLLRKYLLSIPCMLFGMAVPLLINTDYIYLTIVLFMLIIFSVMIVKHSEINYFDFAYAISGTALITFGMSALPAICMNGYAISFFFVTAFTLPWMADAGGFFVGATLGKHKLCPNISPKKTVEGAVGGVVFCVLAAVLIGLLFQFAIMPEAKINFFALILLGIIDAVVSILGDLSFSLIKRSLKIKDYSSVFPGHGGMLDRFDSIIFTAPVLVVLNQILPLVTMV